MAEDKENKINHIRSRIQEGRHTDGSSYSIGDGRPVWQAVSNTFNEGDAASGVSSAIDFVGKNLEDGKFANESFQNANFSVANLTNVDFSGADLRGVDFSGANLSGANLSGADLSGAVLSGAVLHGTNFTGAKLNGVKLTDVDLDNAILLDIEIDELGIEELQALIEYLAKYYPHKLNLTKMNLTLLDLSKIDLSKVNLRGVDFTGVDFTGVNIMELDLSECIITPQQIAQALGRVPSKEELARILAPKKKTQKNYRGLDISDIFLGDGREFGVLDFAHDKGISIESLMKLGKKVFRRGAEKPPIKDEEALKNIRTEQENKAKSHNEELRRVIEERKRKELEVRIAMKQELEKEAVKEETQKEVKRELDERIISRGRDGR